MTADLRLPFMDFSPFIFPFYHFSFPLCFVDLEMSQTKNMGRQFTIDLDDDDDDIDFGQIRLQNFSIEMIVAQREERECREREESQRRST